MLPCCVSKCQIKDHRAPNCLLPTHHTLLRQQQKPCRDDFSCNNGGSEVAGQSERPHPHCPSARKGPASVHLASTHLVPHLLDLSRVRVQWNKQVRDGRGGSSMSILFSPLKYQEQLKSQNCDNDKWHHSIPSVQRISHLVMH